MSERIKFSQLIFPEDLKESTQTITEELYKSIVIDRKNRDFKIITGDFESKKDLIDFYDSDYIVKRVFLKDVFDWIPKHSKSPLDSYLMYSIAVSKWKNNNMLKDYYTQLLKDIPDADNLDEAVGDSVVGGVLRPEDTPVIVDHLFIKDLDGNNCGIFGSQEEMNSNITPLLTLTKEELEEKVKKAGIPNELLTYWSQDID